MSFEKLSDLNEEERYEKIASFVPNIKKAAKSNEDIKYIRSALKGKGKDDEAIISGISIIESVIDSDIRIKHLIIYPEEIYTERAFKCVLDAAKRAEKTLAVSESTFAIIAKKKNSNGLAALIELPFKTIDNAKPQEINIVMDALELPGNVGTLIRTADGAGLESVIITNPKVRLNNTTLLAASRGAFAKVNIIVDSVENIAEWAKKHGIKIFLADTRAKDIHTDTDLGDKVCFVVGCERYGIDEKWYEKKHELLKIPMLGSCDSLNVGVAGSVLIYEALRQRK